MAHRKPSERRNFCEPDQELNLTPMMNLVTILIPILLVSAVFIEISVLEIALPGKPAPDTPEGEPLSLAVTLTENGYTVATSGGVLDKHGDVRSPDASGPSIPLLNRQVSCNGYVGTRPPPRARNKGAPKCTSADESVTYWIYDTVALRQRLIEIKEAFPGERAIIITADPDIQYEAITNVIDASHEYDTGDGTRRPLFDQVQVRPSI